MKRLRLRRFAQAKIVSAQPAKLNPLLKDFGFLTAGQLASSANTMKIDTLKRRLDQNRPMKTMTMQMPEDVIEDLKRIAPLLGFSGYQPLARAYIGKGCGLIWSAWKERRFQH